MKAVAASAGFGIVQWKLEVIGAQEPVESRPGLGAPAAVAGYAVSLQTCGNRAGGLDRLLIEAGLFATLAIETLGADGHEVAPDFVTLASHQPIQRFQTGRDHALVPAGRA